MSLETQADLGSRGEFHWVPIEAMWCGSAPSQLARVMPAATERSSLRHSDQLMRLSSKCNFACSGTWYNILEWAARSTSCSEAPDSVACMACSQAMPAYAQAAGVGPIGRRC